MPFLDLAVERRFAAKRRSFIAQVENIVRLFRAKKLRSLQASRLRSSQMSNYRFYLPQIKWQWFCTIPDGDNVEEANNQKSVAGLNTYWFPEGHKERQIETFSNIDFAQMNFKPHRGAMIKFTLKANFSFHLIHNRF